MWFSDSKYFVCLSTIWHSRLIFLMKACGLAGVRRNGKDAWRERLDGPEEGSDPLDLANQTWT